MSQQRTKEQKVKRNSYILMSKKEMLSIDEQAYSREREQEEPQTEQTKISRSQMAQLCNYHKKISTGTPLTIR